MPGISIKVPQLEVERARDMLDVMGKKGLTQVDLVTESAGSIRAMIAVALAPDKFRNLVLVHPAEMDNWGYFVTHGHVVRHQTRSHGL